jgi:hypothetical protein
MVKGDRMANVHASNTQVIDLASQTITDINFEKKTYSVMTFDEMRKMLDQMAKKMSEKKAENPDAKMNFKIDIKNTGKTQVWNGIDTKQAILTLIMEGTDQKSGQTGNLSMVSDMFMAPKIPGYEEVRDFHMRMAQKLNWNPSSSGFAGMMQPGASEGMAELAKEAAKLEGVPVRQIVRMGSMEAITAAMNAPPKPEGQAEPAPSAGKAAGDAATASAAESIAGSLGKLGGLGGFGKKKKKEPEQQPPPAEATPEQQQQAQAAALLMEMTTDSSNFSSAPVDASKFEVPAGYKKVDSPAEKMK